MAEKNLNPTVGKRQQPSATCAVKGARKICSCSLRQRDKVNADTLQALPGYSSFFSLF